MRRNRRYGFVTSSFSLPTPPLSLPPLPPRPRPPLPQTPQTPSAPELRPRPRARTPSRTARRLPGASSTKRAASCSSSPSAARAARSRSALSSFFPPGLSPALPLSLRKPPSATAAGREHLDEKQRQQRQQQEGATRPATAAAAEAMPERSPSCPLPSPLPSPPRSRSGACCPLPRRQSCHRRGRRSWRGAGNGDRVFVGRERGREKTSKERFKSQKVCCKFLGLVEEEK